MQQKSNLKNRLFAIVTLALLSMILAELISASSPASDFFSPNLFFYLLIFGYGLPAVLFRDLCIRANLGYGGILLVGMAFGVYSEGLLAKTLTITSGVPISQFNDYGYILGVSWPWLVIISVWHALASIMVPMLITNRLVPSTKNSPLVGMKTSIFLTALLLWAASGSFLNTSEKGITGTTSQLIILLITIALLIGASFFFKRKEETGTASKGAIFLGIGMIIVLFAVSVIAGLKLPLIIFFIAFLIIFYFFKQKITKNWKNEKGLILFGLGLYIQSATIGVLTRFIIQDKFIEALFIGVIFEIIFIVYAKKLLISRK